jgi:hypothetical protein
LSAIGYNLYWPRLFFAKELSNSVKYSSVTDAGPIAFRCYSSPG